MTKRGGLGFGAALFLIAGACSSKDPILPPEGGSGGIPGVGGIDGTGVGGEPGFGGSGVGGRYEPGVGGRIGGTGGAGTGGECGYSYFPYCEGALGGEDGYGGNGFGGIPGTGGQVVAGIGGSPGTGGESGSGGSPATSCAQVASQADCDLRSDCYSVFFDPQNCACAGAGCCAHFDHCANRYGGAQCYGGVSCAVATPVCEGTYVIAYRNDCFEGCVASKDCAPVCTPGVDQTCNDNPIVSSLHGHCTDAGACQCGTGFIMNPNTGLCL